jgi:hypothetical protein
MNKFRGLWWHASPARTDGVIGGVRRMEPEREAKLLRITSERGKGLR